LDFNYSDTLFPTGSSPFKETTQSITFTNRFSLPMAVYSIEVTDHHFKLVDFPLGQVVAPGASWVSFLFSTLPSFNLTFLVVEASNPSIFAGSV
jgi:hypothetical protein